MKFEERFDIDNLINDVVESKLAALNSNTEKTKLLLALAEMDLLTLGKYSFSRDEINGISEFYRLQTFEAFEGYSIDENIKNLILEFSKYFSMTDIKNLINNFCDDDINGDDLVEETKQKLKKEKQLQENNFIDNIRFDEMITPEGVLTSKDLKKKEPEKKMSISEKLKFYQNQIKENDAKKQKAQQAAQQAQNQEGKGDDK